MAEWKKVVVSGSSAALSGLTVDATISGDIDGNAATVTTNANLTGDVTSVGNTTTIANGAVETAMIADLNVTNAKLANDGLMIGTTDISLGATGSSLAGLTNVTLSGRVSAGNVGAADGSSTITGSFVGDGSALTGLPDATDSKFLRYATGSGNFSIAPAASENNGTASGNYSVVAGGEGNTASSVYSGVLAGEGNCARAESSAVLAGKNNCTGTSADYSVIGGGDGNEVTGEYSALMNGNASTLSGDYAFIGSGTNHTLSGNYGTISGGYSNTVSGESGTVAGGSGNTASGNKSTVVGGGNNAAQALNSTVGGCDNTVTNSGNYSTISGGYTNTISAQFGGILGGRDNTVNTACSFIVGSGISSTVANHTHVSNLTTAGNITGSNICGTGRVQGATMGVADGSSTITGSFVGDGSALTGLPAAAIETYSGGVDNRIITAVNGTSVQGETNLTFDGSTLAVTGNATISTDLTVSRNLIVQGTASFQSTEDLDIKDRFIRMASGSTSAGDGGIVIQQTSATNGEVFGFDSTQTRFGVSGSFDASQNSFTPDAFLSAVVVGGVGEDASDVVARYQKPGNIFVQDNGEVHIYV